MTDPLARRASAALLSVAVDQPAIALPLIDRNGRVITFSTADDGNATRFPPGKSVSRIANIIARTGQKPAAPFGPVVDQPGPNLIRRMRAGMQRGAVALLVAPSPAASCAGIVAGDIVIRTGGAQSSLLPNLNAH
ncbi:hypothetical protein [Sphingopyxis sp.]|uniref:hypothetical protein n=1 Tax=Sphingopyxis sp. TaxID=1908224 RepID=UPI001D4F1CE7|nr:hypothetical protein [Sphingopyxis sp.]MBW8296301.1 hypothetical protein [Sphingopyxis sp.]